MLAVQELIYPGGRLLSATYYRPMEILTTVALIYFIVIWPGSLLSAWLERRLARHGGRGAGWLTSFWRRGLCKRAYGPIEVLRGIDLKVRAGERIAIIGSSGSGKSTLLRCLNFMEVPSKARCCWTAYPIGVPRRLPRWPRHHGLFAGGALPRAPARRHGVPAVRPLPAYDGDRERMEGLRTVKRLPRAEARGKAMARPSASAWPRSWTPIPRLSGDSSSASPSPLHWRWNRRSCCSEPASSLDRSWWGKCCAASAPWRSGTTMLLVTHELGFAFHVATRVIFLADGVFRGAGTPVRCSATRSASAPRLPGQPRRIHLLTSCRPEPAMIRHRLRADRRQRRRARL